MHTTKYLTGKDSSEYPELEPLRTKRINDMRNLLKTLRMEARGVKSLSTEYQELMDRYQAVEKAIEFWENL